MKDYEQVTRTWTANPQDEQTLQLRQLLSDTLRVNYFKLDALQRGCTIYHRNGNLVGNGA